MHKRCHNTSREIPRSANGSHHHHTETQHKTCWSRTSVAPPNRYLKVFQPNHNSNNYGSGPWLLYESEMDTHLVGTLLSSWQSDALTRLSSSLAPPLGWRSRCRFLSSSMQGCTAAAFWNTDANFTSEAAEVSAHKPTQSTCSQYKKKKKEFRERINTEKVQSLDRRNFFLMKMRTKNIYQQISSRDWDETMTS